MFVKVKNLFSPPARPQEPETFELIAETPEVRIERIYGTRSYRNGKWYDQAQDEWVVLLQGVATLEFESGEKSELKAGDSIFIPARKSHRVAETSDSPPCVWLAVHGNFKKFH
ncbi:MAG: hypothetical protein Kow00127_02890 [Bacteroidales bacterium]